MQAWEVEWRARWILKSLFYGPTRAPHRSRRLSSANRNPPPHPPHTEPKLLQVQRYQSCWGSVLKTEKGIKHTSSFWPVRPPALFPASTPWTEAHTFIAQAGDQLTSLWRKLAYAQGRHPDAVIRGPQWNSRVPPENKTKLLGHIGSNQLLRLTIKYADQPQIATHLRKSSHLTNRSQNKRQKGSQDNVESKLTLKKKTLELVS